MFTTNLVDFASCFSVGGVFPMLSVMMQEPSAGTQSIANVLLTTNNIWMMLATALVFIMHLGFASVEAGFTQSKNTVNILFKNTLTPVLGIVTYALLGFALMYPGDFNGFLGFGMESWDTIWFNSAGADVSEGYADGGYTFWTDFLFQAMFAATAATIVSGAVAERIKLGAYLTFTLFYVGVVYPIIGSWKWGGGFLDELGFVDFAGSTLVHSVGGWGALVGIWLLGPRIGKYNNGKTSEISGSSVPLATIGVFLLWLGWFGFNGGSVLSADPGLTSLVLVTTTLGACGGAIGGHFTSMIVMKRIDFGMVLNGVLAGLVGVTAGADIITPLEALFIGGVAGILVVFSVVLLDKMKLDDCVGAVSVHLTCGVWGTLATGIFGEGASFMSQLYGVIACGAAAIIGSFVIFYILKVTMGLRVSEEAEKHGLDSEEHGIRGYTILLED
ncbi:ammonium transporter [Sphingobacterium sp. SGR-19]|uniref:ammonium transporter n=1 Tax=Sphingobacterium sp. SGR-19 TaxID=2710886 RepID=UPI001F0D63B4|nr:ammonium transporter [Sphingobacterium sp. SGR-19]